MQLKYVSLAALAGSAAAQSLNSTLAGNNQLSNLTQILGTQPALVEALMGAKNITILAPNNDAFAKLMSGPGAEKLTEDPGMIAALLSYHVLNGTYTASQLTNMSAFVPTLLMNKTYSNVTGGQVVEGVKIGNGTYFFSGLLQNSTVTQADVNFTGGVIHIIDTVLTLPLDVSSTTSATNLTALRGALNATELTEVIDTTPDLTIFAPNNDAFQSIASGLTNLSTSDLVDILGYHVINGTVGYSPTLENNTSLQTVQGGNVTITIQDGTVFVNAAKVIIPNVLVANGVVHVIDNILNPEATTARPSPSATTGAPAFSGSSASNVPFTSGQPTPSMTVNPTEAGPGQASSTASSTGVAVPMKTGAVGAAALFGAGVVLMGY